MNSMQKILAAVFVLAAGSAEAAGPTAADTARSQYDAERSRCMAGTTGQDQASCLKSAGAAYDAIRQNRLSDANGNYRANALDRCKNLPTADRVDCEARIDGDGTSTSTSTSTSSGSVKSGGIIRETVTTSGPTPVPAVTK